MQESLFQFFSLLQNSLSIVYKNWYFFTYLLVVPGAFSIIALRGLSEFPIKEDIKAVLSFLWGVLCFSFLSLIVAVLKIKPSPILGLILFLVALIILFWEIGRLQSIRSLNLLFLALFAFIILLIRLMFVQNLIVPPYADSIHHLQIVKDFLNPESKPQDFYHISSEIKRYYHFGFHSLDSWLSGSTLIAPEKSILWLGQYFQTMAVIGIYPLTRAVFNKNTSIAWVATIVAGLLLPIPAYASNWGKYPAIASLTGILVTLTLIILETRKSNPPKKSLIFVAITAFFSFFLHSRSVFIFLPAMAILIIQTRTSLFSIKSIITKNNEDNIKATVLISLLTLLFILTVLVFTDQKFYIYLLPIFGLLLLAFYFDFANTSLVATAVLVVGIGALIPFPSPFHPNQFLTLFDPPFLTIILYIPLSLLVVIILDGCFGMLTILNSRWQSRIFLTTMLLVGLANVIFFQNHKPSSCCVYLNDDDLFSYEWIRQNLPEDSIVGIATIAQKGSYLPADGGGWIESITGIPTRKIDTNTDFSFIARELCFEGVNYYYLDDLETSFDEYTLIQAGGLHQFSLGGVRIYKFEC